MSVDSRVDNARLRAAWEDSGLSLREVAFRAGWLRTHLGHGPMGDATRAGRALGVRREPPAAGHQLRRYMRRSTAETLCSALALDPMDVGI